MFQNNINIASLLNEVINSNSANFGRTLESELVELRCEAKNRVTEMVRDYEADRRHILNNFSNVVATREIARLNAKFNRRISLLKNEIQKRKSQIERRYHQNRTSYNHSDFDYPFASDQCFGGDGGYYHDGSWLTMW